MMTVRPERNDDPANQKWKRQIVAIANTPPELDGLGVVVRLECGHHVVVIGPIERLEGIALCLDCKKQDQKRRAESN